MEVIESYLSRYPTFYKPSQGGNYDLRKEKPDFVYEEEKWIPLHQIEGMKAPLGTTFGYIFKEVFEERIAGYIPVICFVSGGYEIKHGINLIFNGAIRNDNVIRNQRNLVGMFGTKYQNVVLYKAHLTFIQRIAFVAIGLTLIVRGLIDFCQIGIIFLPIDLLLDRLKPLAPPKGAQVTG